MDNFTDEQLVKAYLEGDEQALDVLVGRYLNPLYNFAFKYTHSETAAEDVTQEAMVKIWRNIKKFNPQYKFKTWAYTITKNTALDHLKKKGLVPLAEFNDIEDAGLMPALTSRALLPEQAMERIENVEMVKLAVDKLPDKYKNVLSLYYEHDLNFREIAELLKQSIDTIKTQHRRAVIYLKRELTGKE